MGAQRGKIERRVNTRCQHRGCVCTGPEVVSDAVLELVVVGDQHDDDAGNGERVAHDIDYVCDRRRAASFEFVDEYEQGSLS